MKHREYIEAGHRVFGLWEITPENTCGCGNPQCPDSAAGKHPRASNWQNTPEWSDEQLETLEEMGHFQTGFGVVVDGLLIIDVDERNGGVDSFAKLCEQIPEVSSAGMIVRTGSGGQSRHLYFKLPRQIALRQSLEQYKGIDFKSSGYVVGAGSLHTSGNRYELVYGSLDDIDDAPEALIEALKKPERHRAIMNGEHVDISEQEIAEMLSYVDSGASHEVWYRCGMAVHHATGGAGFDIWDKWSSTSEKYPGSDILARRWHSFGKSGNPVTLGTLSHYAEEGGWKQSVEFVSNIAWHDESGAPAEGEKEIDLSGIDLLRPPGFAGKICDWINGRNRYSRESLSVAASLATISSVAGMRYIDPLDGITPNLFLFGVAGSATGKESVLKSHQDLLRSAGVSAAVHGGIKSEQEIYRNLTRHQAALYVLDELGEQLTKIQNARNKGTSAYLEGVVGAFLAIYSKANGHALITGDLKEEIRKAMGGELNALEKRKAENEATQGDEARLLNLKRQMATLDSGLENPYLCLFGLTTPERFGLLMDFDMAVNGFLGRAIIFTEREDNPKSKPRHAILPSGVPDYIAATLQQLYAPGISEVSGRIERVGEHVKIATRADAEELLERVANEFWEMAETSKNNTGLTAIPRRGYEQVAKISMILAIPEGLRTVEHVRWAYALVKRDVVDKMNLVNSNNSEDKSDALASLIMGCVTSDHGETIGRIRNRCRKYKKTDVDETIKRLVDAGRMRFEPMNKEGSGRKSEKYFACK